MPVQLHAGAATGAAIGAVIGRSAAMAGAANSAAAAAAAVRFIVALPSHECAGSRCCAKREWRLVQKNHRCDWLQPTDPFCGGLAQKKKSRPEARDFLFSVCRRSQ